MPASTKNTASKDKGKDKPKREARPVLRTRAEKRARLAELEKVMEAKRGGWKLYQQKRDEYNGAVGKANQDKAKAAQLKHKDDYTTFKRAYTEHIALRKELGIEVRQSTRKPAEAEAPATAEPQATGDGSETEQ